MRRSHVVAKLGSVTQTVPHRFRVLARPRGQSTSSGSDTRLATRLRLDGWREAQGLEESYNELLKSGRLQANAAQASAVTCLSELPKALNEARGHQKRWEEEQQRLTHTAERSAAVDRRKKAADWRPGWLSGSPSMPEAPAIIGRVCWLHLGPPPSMRPAGCYVYGSVGSGKSTIVDLFCLTQTSGWRVRRLHFHEFAVWLHQELRRLGGGKDEPHKHVLERVADAAAKGTDILCLDEFAVTNVADAAVFTRLLGLLAARHVAVVCTTNRPPEDLYKDGLHRERYIPELTKHLRNNFLVLGISGSDYREALLRAEAARVSTRGPGGPGQVFFRDMCPEAALQEALKDSLEHLRPSEMKVSWGRVIQVCAGDGVARFHFNDLCRSALSAEDFLILAAKFHTIFIHDVPRLALEEHNEARRFTNLIDAIYEHSVRLLCHSHVPIDEVLKSIEVLQEATDDGQHDADRLGVFEAMYDDSPNFQLQIKELGSREKWKELQDRQAAERQRAEAQRLEARRLGRLKATAAVEGDSGSGWSAAPAGADLSAPDTGVAGVMVAAVGSLQESGFAAKRAASRLKEMQTGPYLEAARRRRESLRGA